MAREKSKYKSGINKAARAFTKLIEAVEDAGGGDENIACIETDESLRRQIADLIVGSYEEEVDYDDPQWKEIDRSRYAFVGDVTAADYPETQTGKKKVRFREVWLDHDPLDDEILQLAKQIKCRQPSRAESETVIRKRYTKDQLAKNPRIGLIGPAVQRDGSLDRACVSGVGGGVDLRWLWTESQWSQHCRFILVCED